MPSPFAIHHQIYGYIHAFCSPLCATCSFQLIFHHRQQTQSYDARSTQDASCSQLSLYPRERAHVRTAVFFQLEGQWHTPFTHRQTPPRHLYRHTSMGLISLAARQRVSFPSTVTDVSTCRNQNLAPIEWLCGGWPPPPLS